jgi:hypothetical protein
MRDRVPAIIAGILMVGFLIFGVWIIGKAISVSPQVFSGGGASASYIAPSEPATKPITKTRCDYTGFMAPSMIEEEAQQGYFYTGRVATFLCEDAMVFQLREVK